MTTTLEDVEFADDLVLISSTFTQIQKKIDRLNRKRERNGIENPENQGQENQPHEGQCMQTKTTQSDGQEVENVHSFDYPSENNQTPRG